MRWILARTTRSSCSDQAAPGEPGTYGVAGGAGAGATAPSPEHLSKFQDWNAPLGEWIAEVPASLQLQ